MEIKNDLIAALATSDSVSAIALLRLSGKGASKTVEELMKLEPGRLAGMKRAVGDFAGIDFLVAISWPEGKSYTGEEMVDLMCHGSPGTAGRILKKLESSGARLAQPGEFTRRAWMNGRLNALDILSLSQKYAGNVSDNGSNMSRDMLDLITEMEAFIEFSDEHEIDGDKSILNMLEFALEKTIVLSEQVKMAEILPRAFIMGPVNAGKSTLFNRLCGQEAAIVSPVPGTTRDGAVRTVTISGRQVQIHDTAGTGGESLDRQALSLSITSMRKGDRVVWMDPACSSWPENIPEGTTVLKIQSRSDEAIKRPEEGWTPASAETGAGIEQIIGFLTATEPESPSWRLDRIIGLLERALLVAHNDDLALAAEIVHEILYEAEQPERNGDAVERALEKFCVGK